MAQPISDAARRIVQAVIDIEEAESRGAGWQEIADRVDRGLGTVQDHVASLIKKRYLAKESKYLGIRALRNPDGSRRLRAPVEVIDGADVVIHVRGFINAGPSAEPIDSPDAIELRGLLESGPESFWLRVRGNSMRDAGIRDMDLVKVRRQPSVEPGEIAVCLLEDGGITLKCVVRDAANGRVSLAPACEGLEPVPVNDVTIQGRVVKVIRDLE